MYFFFDKKKNNFFHKIFSKNYWSLYKKELFFNIRKNLRIPKFYVFTPYTIMYYTFKKFDYQNIHNYDMTVMWLSTCTWILQDYQHVHDN